MAQLWGGRFTKQEDALVNAFNASILFDRRLYREDIEGSIAHAEMLGAQAILTKEDTDAIVGGLKSILNDLEAGKIQITDEYEDIHSFVEAVLTDRIGKAGKMLHTGRSRNDQVAVDMRLYARRVCKDTDAALKSLLGVILDIMKANTRTYMPGFTHMQKAQPVTLAHHMGCYFEMFRRDRSRVLDCMERLNECPLGAGALAGTTYPLDREMTAGALGFDCATRNSMDSVSDRDYVIELLSSLSLIMMHLSRFSEELIIWNSNEYGFVEMDDAYSTGSSIMPQKKNPDICELVRGKTGRVYGSLMSLMTTMKGIPLAYDKDMQEDKEVFFDAADSTLICLKVFTGMLSTVTFRKDTMERSALNGFSNATDAADYLVGKGIPFRDAHTVIGKLVVYCIEQHKAIADCTIDELRQFSTAFDSDIYEAISLEACVGRRNTKGAPGPDAIQQEIEESENYLTCFVGASDRKGQ